MDAEQQQQAKRLLEYRQQLLDAGEARQESGDLVAAGKQNDPMIYRGLYAPSGFDMMSILIRVATRPYPTFTLGAIDSSCALILCDLLAPDAPIVYASDSFLALTNYTAPEILGRNCRLLQSPDGIVAPGQPRVHTDEKAVYELKRKVGPGVFKSKVSVSDGDGTGRAEKGAEKWNGGLQEVQVCLRNYKKGGEPFENLLTVVPIAWNEGGEVRYIVGFQVDRVKAFA